MTKRLAVLLLICLLFTSIAAFQQVGAASRAIVVPDNYPSITAAIANAADGDVIYVRSGVYNEFVLEINSAITIRGEDVRNTIVNLTPPLTNYTDPIFGHTWTYPSTAIKINSNNVKISGLTIKSPGSLSGKGDGIELISNVIALGRSGNLTASKLTIARNTLSGDYWILTGSNLTLTENILNVTNNGLQTDGDYCNIHGNAINGTLWLQSSSSSAITNNIYNALFLRRGDSNLISHNFGELSMGNSPYTCSNNIVSGNVMKGPIVWGIWLGAGVKNNVFYDNYIADQANDPYSDDYGAGVIFVDHPTVAISNTFYHNVFVNNTHQVRFYADIMVGGNSWDNGSLGNYWDDYNGTDANGDGVGDTPYIINSANSDNHPLIAPFNVPSINVPPPVYDSPITIEPPVSQQYTEAPTTTTNPTQSTTNDNPATQSPIKTNSPASIVTVSEFATAVILLLASVVFLITVAVALWLKKSKT